MLYVGKLNSNKKIFFFFKDLFIYLFRESEREAETQAEGEAGSMKEARRGTPSRVSRITPWAAGGAKPLRHRGYRLISVFKHGIG